MPMFPDSGVPAGDAKNTIDVNTPAGCQELWYSTSRCQPRFDPAAANAMLAEIFNHIMRGEVVYDCKNLDHVERATRYMIQRGIPRGGYASAGPNDYLVALDPPATRYNDYMTLTVVPSLDNAGAVRVNINGLGLVPVLRNDGSQLLSRDWKVGRPTVIACWQGIFYHTGLVASQMPKGPLETQVDLWVNNAFGSDNNDGLANVAGRALLTLQRAINIAFNYQPGPYPVVIHVMNGIGPYAGGATPIFSGPSLNVVGEGPGTMLDGGAGSCFNVSGPNNAVISNIAVRGNQSPGSGGIVSASNGASLNADQIYVYECGGGSAFQSYGGSLNIGRVTFYGSAYCLFWANYGGAITFGNSVCTVAAPITVALATAFAAGNGSMGVASTVAPFGGQGLVTGPKYLCSLNGVINDTWGGVANPWFPGSLPGMIQTGGQYV